jgi:uncharacterized protein YoxC
MNAEQLQIFANKITKELSKNNINDATNLYTQFKELSKNIDRKMLQNIDKIMEDKPKKKLFMFLPEGDIRNIAYESIDDNYTWAKYCEFNIIMMKKNGYINATHLCKLEGKQFKHWLENKNSKELINEVNYELNSAGIPTKLMHDKNSAGIPTKLMHDKNSAGIPTKDIIIKNMAGSFITRGTYVHPDLIPHVASWTSPKFAVKVSKIVNNYAIKEFEDKINSIIESKDKKIKAKDDKIDKLSSKIDKLLSKVDNLNETVEGLNSNIDELHTQNDELLDKVDSVCEDKVVKSDDIGNKPAFVIMKNNGNTRFKYYVIRSKNKYIMSAVKRYQDRYSNTTKLLDITYNPNAVNLWDRIKEKSKGKLIIRANYFNRHKCYSEEQLITDIKKINDEKYE